MSNRFLTLFCRKSSVQRVQEDMAADQAGPPKKPTRYFFFLFQVFVFRFGFSVSVESHEVEVPPLLCIII